MARTPSRASLRAPMGAARRRMRTFGFFGETLGELQKVTWPTREQTTRLTMLVILISATIGLALGVTDGLFFRLFDLTLFR